MRYNAFPRIEVMIVARYSRNDAARLRPIAAHWDGWSGPSADVAAGGAPRGAARPGRLGSSLLRPVVRLFG